MIRKAPLKPIFILSLIFLIRIQTIAQHENKPINYSKHPYWIEMMNNPASNYFETLKAYDEFWAKRKKPMEEEDIIGQDKSAVKKQTLLQRWFKSKEEKEEEEARKYKLDVKKFEHWKLKVKPYVQEDGRILSAEEQLKFWQQHQQ